MLFAVRVLSQVETTYHVHALSAGEAAGYIVDLIDGDPFSSDGMVTIDEVVGAASIITVKEVIR